MKRYCLALDLRDDPALIAEYEAHHKNVWPEILKSIRASGIHEMQIYRFANRLFMVIEAEDSFSFEKKGAMDRDNPKVQEWEQLMWKYQQGMPGAPKGAKWMLMEKIFDLP